MADERDASRLTAPVAAEPGGMSANPEPDHPPPTSASLIPELALLRLDLRAVEDAAFRAQPAPEIHGAVHALLGDFAPRPEAALHRAPVKPLTLSPLYRAADGSPVGRSVRAGERVWVRLGVLEAETVGLALLALAAAVAAARTVALDTRRFLVESFAPDGGPGRVPALTTYARLLAAVKPVAEVVLGFRSPTVFRHKGEAVGGPSPRHVFGSYLRRWEAFAPAGSMPLGPEALARTVALVEHRTVPGEPWDIGRTREPGFCGEARYRVAGDAATQRAVAALAAYAAYCGTGARTAYGMGQTEWFAGPAPLGQTAERRSGAVGDPAGGGEPSPAGDDAVSR